MILIFKNRQVELTSLLGCLVVSVFFWPFAQDDYASFLGNMASGQFSDFSLVDWYFLGYTGFNYIYKALHTFIPQINWLGLGTYIMSIVGFYVCLRAVNTSLKPVIATSTAWLVSIFFGLFYLDSFISICHTRASLIMCGGAALYLLIVPKIGFKKLIILNLVYISGLLHRGESAIGILWIVGLASLLFSLPIGHTWNRLGPLVLYSALFFIAVSVYWSHSTSFIVKVEPEIEYEFMSGNIVELATCKSETDSAKYLMATYGIWIDPNNVTADYMRTLITDSKFSVEKILGGIEIMKSYFLFYSVSFLLGLALIWLFILKRKSSNAVLKLVLFLILGLLPMLYAAYKGLLSERHFFPMLFILGLVTVVYFLHKWNNLTPISVSFKWIGTLALFITIFATLFATFDTLGNYKIRNKVEASQVACSEQAMAKLENKFSKRTIVLTTGSFHIMDHNFSIWTKNYTRNNYVMYDLFNYSLVPRYLEYQSKLCNCDASQPVNFFGWLSSQNALYLGEDERLRITSAYVKSIYKRDLQFLPVKDFSLESCLKNHYSYLRSTNVRQVQMKSI